MSECRQIGTTGEETGIVERVSVRKITAEGCINSEDTVVREVPVTVLLNGEEFVTLLATPTDLDCLAVGFLASEGLLQNKAELKNVLVDDVHGIVRVNTIAEIEGVHELTTKRLITSGCGKGVSFYRAADVQEQILVKNECNATASRIVNLVKDFQQRSILYRETGGVHSAALCTPDKILVFMDDIGRHNAVDKVFGECLLKRIPTDGMIIVTSGRISSEIILKVARRNIPVLVSRSAPTSLGVRTAHNLGVTLAGFVRGSRMNVYTHAERIIAGASAPDTTQ